jgi:hypothetical protein
MNLKAGEKLNVTASLDIVSWKKTDVSEVLTWRNIPEGCHSHTRRRENLKSRRCNTVAKRV